MANDRRLSDGVGRRASDRAGQSFSRRDQLIEQLGSADADVRRRAAEDLEDLRDASAAPSLLKAVTDAEVGVREAAVDALVAIGGLAVCERVVPLLESEDVSLRNYAMEILERIGPDSIDVLVGCCSWASSDVRKFALDLLGKVGKGYGDRCLEAVAALLEDDNPNVAGSAAEALGYIGDPRAVPYLGKHVSGPPWMQWCVFAALSQIGGEGVLKALGSVDVAQLSPVEKHFYESALKITKVSVERP